MRGAVRSRHRLDQRIGRRRRSKVMSIGLRLGEDDGRRPVQPAFSERQRSRIKKMEQQRVPPDSLRRDNKRNCRHPAISERIP
jgi:hypothetical protein